MPTRVDSDRIRLAMYLNSRRNAVGLRIDHRDSAGLRVDHVNLIAHRVHGQTGWIRSDLQGSVLAKINKIEHSNGIRPAVTDVGKLMVTIRDVREAAPSTARQTSEERADCGGKGSQK